MRVINDFFRTIAAVFFAVHVVGLFAACPVDAQVIEKTLVGRVFVEGERVKVSSNDVVTIFREISDLGTRNELLKGRSDNHSYQVLLGESRIGVELWVDFFGNEKIDHADVLKHLQSYIELRWKGLSKEGAFDILSTEAKEGPDQAVYRDALRQAAPWLPFGKLKKLPASTLVSVWWINKGDDYIYEDKEISYVVRFGDVITEVFPIDSQELNPKYRARFAIASRDAKLRSPKDKFGNLKGSLLYWKYLKDNLHKSGLKWRSPEELAQGFVTH